MFIYLIFSFVLFHATHATELANFKDHDHTSTFEKNSLVKNQHPYKEYSQDSNVPKKEQSEDPLEKNAIETAKKENIQDVKITRAINRRKELIQTRKDLAEKDFHITPGGFVVFH